MANSAGILCKSDIQRVVQAVLHAPVISQVFRVLADLGRQTANEVRKFCTLRAIGQFNFTVATNPQAAPTAYKVGVGSLSTTGITTGSKMRVIGFVNPVDVPSDDDLTAESMVDRSTTNSLLLCQWIPAVTSAISSSTSSEITLDVSAALIKQVTDGFGTTALSNSPTPAKLQPLLPIGIYRIVQGGAVELHVGFESFVQSLGQRIGPSGKVFRIAALGTFEASTQTQKTYLMSVILL